MRSGGGVLVVSTLQLFVGFVLLGVYEGYKVSLHRATLIAPETDTCPPPRTEVLTFEFTFPLL